MVLSQKTAVRSEENQERAKLFHMILLGGKFKGKEFARGRICNQARFLGNEKPEFGNENRRRVLLRKIGDWLPWKALSLSKAGKMPLEPVVWQYDIEWLVLAI